MKFISLAITTIAILIGTPSLYSFDGIPEYLESGFFFDIANDERESAIPIGYEVPLIDLSPDREEKIELASSAGRGTWGFVTASAGAEARVGEAGTPATQARAGMGSEVFADEIFQVTPSGTDPVAIDIEVFQGSPSVSALGTGGNSASAKQTFDMDFYDADFSRESGYQIERLSSVFGDRLDNDQLRVIENTDPPLEDFTITTLDPFFRISTRVDLGVGAANIPENQDVPLGGTGFGNASASLGFRIADVRGGTIESYSGHDYTVFVPEPGSAGLLSGTLALLVTVAARRRVQPACG